MGVILLTDGLYEAVTPYLLRFNENKVYIPMALLYFAARSIEDADKYVYKLLRGEIGREEYIEYISQYLRNIGLPEDSVNGIIDTIVKNNYPITMIDEVMDDKTVAAVINENGIIEKKPDIYYEEPRWDKFQLEWNKRAYPHLYGSNSDLSEGGIGDE